MTIFSPLGNYINDTLIIKGTVQQQIYSFFSICVTSACYDVFKEQNEI